MKNLISTLLLLAIVSLSYSQNDPLYVAPYPSSRIDSLTTTGDELIIYANHMYLSWGLTSVGAGMVILGASGVTSGDNRPLIMIGGLAMLVGTAYKIEAIKHIQNAGILLNEHGIGVRIPIK